MVSASHFLPPAEALPEPARRPNRRKLILLPVALGGALLLHWLDRAGAPVPRPGPRRFPTRARGGA